MHEREKKNTLPSKVLSLFCKRKNISTKKTRKDHLRIKNKPFKVNTIRCMKRQKISLIIFISSQTSNNFIMNQHSRI